MRQSIPRAYLALVVCALVAPPLASQIDRMVTGYVSEVSPGRLVLVLDRDGFPGQQRGDAIRFTLISSSRVTSREQRPVGVDVIRPRTHANVKYYHGNAGALVVREVQLLSSLAASEARVAPSSTSNSPASPKTSLNLKDLRIQATGRQNDAPKNSVKVGAAYYIGFYVDVDAQIPLTLRFKCFRSDLSKDPRKRADIPLSVCDYEETIPPGFKGLRYRAFPTRFASQAEGIDAIVGQVSLIVRRAGGGQTSIDQRKSVGFMVQP